MINAKSIDVRIREYYTAENGEWLVERGKVKEAKLLKEACELIEKLRRNNRKMYVNYTNLLATQDAKTKELEREKTELTKREEILCKRVQQFREALEYAEKQ